MVVRPELPPLLPDERAEVLRRWGEVAYMRPCSVGAELVLTEVCLEHHARAGEPVEIRMPPDLWRLFGAVSAAGWANARALRTAGQWEPAR